MPPSSLHTIKIDSNGLGLRNTGATQRLDQGKTDARKPIDRLVVDYDVPQELANTLYRSDDRIYRMAG